jgi:hypothetical protein
MVLDSTRRRYGWSNPEMRIYIFPNKSERDEWVAKHPSSREELPANTFVADMRLYAVHHGAKAANACFVSEYSPLKFTG